MFGTAAVIAKLFFSSGQQHIHYKRIHYSGAIQCVAHAPDLAHEDLTIGPQSSGEMQKKCYKSKIDIFKCFQIGLWQNA